MIVKGLKGSSITICMGGCLFENLPSDIQATISLNSMHDGIK